MERRTGRPRSAKSSSTSVVTTSPSTTGAATADRSVRHRLGRWPTTRTTFSPSRTAARALPSSWPTASVRIPPCSPPRSAPNAFAALGLWEPPLPWVAWWPERTKNYNANVASSDTPDDDIEEMYRRLLGDDEWSRLPVDVRDQRRAEGTAFRADMASEIEAPFDFRDVVVPALVGYGSEHVRTWRAGARWLAEALPNARTRAIRGTGHFAPPHIPRISLPLCAQCCPSGSGDKPGLGIHDPLTSQCPAA